MTEKKDFPVFRVGIVTLSDKGYQGEREDKSGPKIKELLPVSYTHLTLPTKLEV